MADNAAQANEWDAFAPVSGETATPEDVSTSSMSASNEWDEFAPVETQDPEQMGDLGMAVQQFSAGVAEGGAGLAGMLKGASYGMRVPIPHPGVKAGLTVLGGITGLVGGSALVNEALEFFGVESPEDLPPEQRPLAYGSRSFGSALPFMAAPFAAASRGVVLPDQGIGRLTNQIINTAKASPKTFAALETSSALSAATAAGLAEEMAPGETGIRIGAEMAGGMLAPGNLTAKAYRSTSKFVRKVASKMSPSARETQAGRMLQEMLDLTDEDAGTLVEILRVDGVLDANGDPITEGLTSAQATGSDALGALQKFLMDNNPDFKAAVAKKEKQALDAMRGLSMVLSRTGDPATLQTAAEVKSQYIRSLLQSMVDNSTSKAVLDASKITDDSPEAISAISTSARESLDATISEVRKAERQMWDAVPTDVDAGLDNLEATYREIKANTLPELIGKRMPKMVDGFLSRKAQEAKGFTEDSVIIVPDAVRTKEAVSKTATTGELKQLRSELLDLGRQATNAGEFEQARIYSDLANSVLDDIDTAFLSVDDEAYNAARTFSREMHEVFSRSFVGKATAQGKYGDRIAPELMLRKAMASGKEAGAMHFQDLENATRFLDSREMGTEVTKEAAATMLDAQERFTRLMFSEAIDPTTGLANAKRLSTMMRQHEAVLKRFPEVETQLKAAVKSEQGRKAVEDFAKGKIRYMEQMKMFEQISGKDPVTIARRALASPNMEKEIQAMVNTAKGGSVAGFDSQEAIKGVSGAVMSAALRNSTDTTGVLNLDKLRASLTQVSATGSKAPLDVLKAKGAIDPQHYDSIQEVFDLLGKMEKARDPGHAVTVGKDMGDAALSFLTRVAGTTMVGRAGGTSIQAHQAGANLAEHIGKKLTSVKMDEIFIRALNDKEFMITLLQKVDSPKAAELQARQINAWLMQSGVGLATSEQESEQ